ncbi:MAG: putative secreted protein [Herbinix sp.]|jgi:hypothetical protein|nr:putative secreted protein [Herbinix sp.]
MGRRSIYAIEVLLLCILCIIVYYSFDNHGKNNNVREETPLTNEKEQDIQQQNAQQKNTQQQNAQQQDTQQQNKQQEDQPQEDRNQVQESTNAQITDNQESIDQIIQEEAVMGTSIQNGQLQEVLLYDLIKESQQDFAKEILRTYPSGTMINTKDCKPEWLLHQFYAEEITQEIKDRITGKSYGDTCDIPYSDLKYLRLLYTGFDGNTHIGELIVATSIAQDILDIFYEFYEAQYPIERMVLVDEYNADDNASMTDNNTSSFNYRPVDGTSRLSLHSYGLAIDINPRYNPYVREIDGKTVITPENGITYADRSLDEPYYISRDDICCQAFLKRGFTWGGDWVTMKDYQHFQKAKEE